MAAWVHPPIRPLSDHLASQIAAGEVVERPASVVKELVENALDAQASSVWVTLVEGGRQVIRVRDDGIGIPQEQLPLALGRHCTSKLQALEQLLDVQTLGFRGEALPSIASVARLRLISCAQGATAAYQVSLEGADGRPQPEPASHPPGTTVEVRELFFNVPARRRFLKSVRTELEHIDAYMRRLAMSRPQVSFHLIHAGRRVFSVAGLREGDGPEVRLGALLGTAFVRAALPVNVSMGDLALQGWVAQPELFAPSDSGAQIWVVNGRVVRDPALAHAVRVALDERLPSGRHPAYTLALGVDPASVDVNVHPTKLEVRHRDPRRVHDFVLSSVRELMGTSAHAKPARLASRASPTPSPWPRSVAPPGGLRPAASLAEPTAVWPAQSVGSGGRSPQGRAWLIERAEGLWVLDLAAHYALRLETAYAEGVPEALPLLVPAEITAVALASERMQTLQALTGLGLVLALEVDRIRLLEAPACLRWLDPPALLRELLHQPTLPSPSDSAIWAQQLADWLMRHWPPPRWPELLDLDPPKAEPEADGHYRGQRLWTWVPLGARQDETATQAD